MHACIFPYSDHHLLEFYPSCLIWEISLHGFMVLNSFLFYIIHSTTPFYQLLIISVTPSSWNCGDSDCDPFESSVRTLEHHPKQISIVIPLNFSILAPNTEAGTASYCLLAVSSVLSAERNDVATPYKSKASLYPFTFAAQRWWCSSGSIARCISWTLLHWGEQHQCQGCKLDQ